MVAKINMFYPFDKGFFGKTLASSNNNVAKLGKSSDLKMDSVDDLIKHFKDQCTKNKFVRSPKTDSFEAGRCENVVDFPNVFSL